MENSFLIAELDMLFVARKTRFLGIAILVGIFLVYTLGLFVSDSNINTELEYMNLITFIFCLTLCAVSVFLKKKLTDKVFSDYNSRIPQYDDSGKTDREKFAARYFNAHILPFGLCDLGGLICITTSLFVNQNIYFASAGFLVTILSMIYNFPKDNDYQKISPDKKIV